MNIHFLELFYYVARFGGITEAVRHMPYGIQQPAVSSQILQLEASLGLTLFHRRPFSLTPAGQELYDFSAPFFGNVDTVAERLRCGVAQHIRLGASEIVLRDHLPAILRNIRKRFRALKLTLRVGYQPQLEGWLQTQELDMAVTLISHSPPAGITALPLLRLPLVLLVSKRCRIASAAELWARDRIDETLISLPPNEAFCKVFQEELGRLKVEWFTGIEVSTLDLVASYVAAGNGIGLSLRVPKTPFPVQVRVLPLDGFAPVTLGVLWKGRTTPLAQALLDEMTLRAKRIEDRGRTS